jgi:GTPase SAR1 family protein
MVYIECSAKEGENIKNLFKQMARDIFEATIERMNNDSLLQSRAVGGSMASTDTTNRAASFSSASGLKVKNNNNK